MCARDQWTHRGLWIARIANHLLSSFIAHGGDKPIEDRPFDIHAFAAQTNLAAVRERRARSARNGSVEVGIGEYDRWIFTAELERQALDIRCSCLHYDRAGATLARERNRSNS